ncbi:hypothetical protein PGT21_028806 [Puccinia graminis f. sp. tritici]|uniref:Secreted protein n=2 Tax=Puccinia graminis f. sp. tritici TaxID=56615 RepID=A0A5B0P9V6_PUCGR|nr:hypothetical protein PGT21_028806 [Puccinia graminis f. sp. tritici]KAA1116914.1 hypothetical protein PGTUg99_030361 [Puccinia graminis f. sp. tritici]
MNCILRLFVALTMVIAVQSATGGSNQGFTCKKNQRQPEAICFVQKDDAGTSKYYVARAPYNSAYDRYSCDGAKIKGTTVQGNGCCNPGTLPKVDRMALEPSIPPPLPGMTKEKYKSVCGKADDPAPSSTTKANP